MSAETELPTYEGACSLCGWQMRRVGDVLRCSRPACRGTRSLPVDIVLADRRAQRLPGFGEVA